MSTKTDASPVNQRLGQNGAKAVPARDRLAADYLPLVQVGSVGLLKAIDKFDPNRGCAFPAFAIPVILGEIKNYFLDHGWAVKVPRKLQNQKLMVERAVEILSQRLGRTPTIPEIGEATGLLDKEVTDTFEIEKYGRPVSLDANHDWNGHGDTFSLLDNLGSDDPQFQRLIDRLDLGDLLRSLDERERSIIYLKSSSGLSQTEITEHLGMSQMHVSRLQRKALGKLKLNLAR